MANSDKNTSQNEGVQKIIAFLQKNIRYISAGILLVALVAVLAKCAGTVDTEPETPDTEISVDIADTENTEPEAYQIDAYAGVNDLISRYYSAYAAGDIDAMASLAAPISENEKSYIQMFSQYVDEYQNLKCYTKSGLEENSYLVNAYVEVKFTGVETTVPSLDFFYVRTDEYGTIYIDNLYSPYNDSQKELPEDEAVTARISEFENEPDVVALLQEVADKYTAARESDPDLETMLSSTLAIAVQEWKATIQVAEESTETETTEELQESQQPEETQDSQEEPEEPSEQSETVYAKERVNVRAAASTDSEKLGTVEMGESLTRTGTEGDWSVIEYNGGTGYIKSEFLETRAAETQTEAAGAGLTEGKVITVNDTVNIRASMSETSEKIGTAYPGEKVTVVMSYAEGWTKVNWNGKTGYIKTDLLQ